MKKEKSFYDFNLDNLEERQERNSLFPKLSGFHLALREELGEAEYQAFFNAEMESFRQLSIQNQPSEQTWADA